MKNLILLLAVLFIGCSEDSLKPEPCQKIISLGWNPEIGKYIKIKDGTLIDVPENSTYQLGQVYCR